MNFETIFGANGAVDNDALRNHRISETALRDAKRDHVGQTRLTLLEQSRTIPVVPRGGARC